MATRRSSWRATEQQVLSTEKSAGCSSRCCSAAQFLQVHRPDLIAAWGEAVPERLWACSAGGALQLRPWQHCCNLLEQVEVGRSCGKRQRSASNATAVPWADSVACVCEGAQHSGLGIMAARLCACWMSGKDAAGATHAAAAAAFSCCTAFGWLVAWGSN